MTYYGPDTISTSAKGVAETDFISATFTVSATTFGKNGPIAKDGALPIIAAIKKVILQNAEKAGIDTGRLKTSFAVDVHNHRQTGEFAGYKASYTMTFTCRNVVESLVVHDALTSIEGVVAPTPIFNVDDTADIHAKAFAAGARNARIKFQNQCKALAVEPNDYALRSWSVQEDQPRGKFLSFREDGTVARAVGMEIGKAMLEMTVVLVYGRTHATPQG